MRKSVWRPRHRRISPNQSRMLPSPRVVRTGLACGNRRGRRRAARRSFVAKRTNQVLAQLPLTLTAAWDDLQAPPRLHGLNGPRSVGTASAGVSSRETELEDRRLRLRVAGALDERAGRCPGFPMRKRCGEAVAAAGRRREHARPECSVHAAGSGAFEEGDLGDRQSNRQRQPDSLRRGFPSRALRSRNDLTTARRRTTWRRPRWRICATRCKARS